jgi:hypothetical protein
MKRVPYSVVAALLIAVAVTSGVIAVTGLPVPRAAVAWAAAAASRYEGFGTTTGGGAGRPRYRVTTLADSGPGSLRDALSLGQRHVVFDVAGDIRLTRPLSVQGSFVTIDGESAPPPGITLRDHGLSSTSTPPTTGPAVRTT